MISPWPYFGGKSTVASIIWLRLGNPPNYVEPFAGSAAVLLARPDEHHWWEQTETVNDADGLLANTLRAIALDPDGVARAADWPVSECDLHARHSWLCGQRDALTAQLEGDPEWCDPKAAGWWIWGACAWIGSGWCAPNAGPWRVVPGAETESGQPELLRVGGGQKRQLPHLGSAGQGINRKLPHLGDAGQVPDVCAEWSEHLRAMMRALANRLRRVRICCGDWSRVCGPTPTFKLGTTGVFLDPPYSTEASRATDCYAVDSGDVAHDVRAWCLANGDNPLLRIALSGYEGEGHEELERAGWDCVTWKARGGYGSQGNGQGRANAGRERLWFNRSCLGREQLSLFADDVALAAPPCHNRGGRPAATPGARQSAL